jgi:hypothetical protein
VAALTPLQEKLAEVHGLALAAPAVLARVEARVDDEALRAELRALSVDARDVQRRCARVAAAWGEDAYWDVLAHAASVERKAGELANAWFRAGTDGVQAYELLAMAEAGEVAATLALQVLGEGDREVAELAAWALAVQERHLQSALDGCVRAAAGVGSAAGL